ncbi:methyltransferase family protein [Sphingomicrobium arenosum]|uniref:methyltransferase family protein n=1 Tax=Sphingomicrobium arenosum TaxID=2233861 RepID=UPI0022410563|nr:isoprenylcysteine carboxylmethyltransferase family protein [Sphingomicrobium arenosum]
MGRMLALLYALAAYGVFFIVFLWFVAFVGDIREVMGFAIPTTVDAARFSAVPAMAAIVDIGLVALFGIHHSVAARLGFKEKLTRSVPKSVERSTYVLLASLLLAALMWWWHPIPASLWDLTGSALEVPVWVLFAIGWFILFTATWLLNHFELFGLQQAFHHGNPAGVPPQQMRTPGWYRLVRHPIYLGFFVALWSAVEMSAGHLVLSAAMTVYILIGIRYEERDLVDHFGEDYADYQRKVGPLLPGLGKTRG